jgi:hypothetical protein
LSLVHVRLLYPYLLSFLTVILFQEMVKMKNFPIAYQLIQIHMQAWSLAFWQVVLGGPITATVDAVVLLVSHS